MKMGEISGWLQDKVVAITGAGYGLLEMRTRGLSLEDVFIRIVAGEEGKNAA